MAVIQSLKTERNSIRYQTRETLATDPNMFQERGQTKTCNKVTLLKKYELNWNLERSSVGSRDGLFTILIICT